jgi:stage III sporulation protein AG
MEISKKQTAWFRRGWVLILGGIVGIGLILLGNQPLMTKGKEADSSEEEQVSDITMYMQTTEDKIAALCARVRGVSNVTVAITLEGDFTCVYAQNVQTEQKEGGSKKQETYVTVGSGAGESPILITRTYPRVSGIGIVCRGGGDAYIRRELIALLEAAYGISSNHIYITEANE